MDIKPRNPEYQEPDTHENKIWEEFFFHRKEWDYKLIYLEVYSTNQKKRGMRKSLIPLKKQIDEKLPYYYSRYSSS